ncbi:transcriptional regulator [Pseudomonas cavernicola]|uniref:Transcriptional regulator n=1 Tax=Pseudomonas cavernicola TaxID=2320866 RepID=A0A418XIJ6_9PSED|nr:transcriptional regulator [Pseudomonas cavernicola]
MSSVTIWREEVNTMPAWDSSETVDELNGRGIAVGMLGRHHFNECFAEVCQLFMRAGYRGGQLQRVVNFAGDTAVYDSAKWTYDDALEWNAPLMSE